MAAKEEDVMSFCKTTITATVELDELVAAVERIIATDEHPTLIEASIINRIREAAAEIERRQEAKRKEPRTCGSCGSYLHECECN